jgi:hypothetical protein
MSILIQAQSRLRLPRSVGIELKIKMAAVSLSSVAR